MNKITLGEKVRDIISGFTGIATERTETIYGDTYYKVVEQTDGCEPAIGIFNQSSLKKEGKGVFHEIKAEIMITRNLGAATPQTIDEFADDQIIDEGNEGREQLPEDLVQEA